MRLQLSALIVFALKSFIVLPQIFCQVPSITIDSRAPGWAIPDPNNVEGLVHFLRNTCVAKDLNFDETQRVQLETLLRETGGSLTTITTDGVPGQTLEELQTIVAVKRAKNRLAFEGLLDPNQEARLVQIAYHIEIARIGLGEALINGFFGENVGVNTEQKPALSIMAAAIDREAVGAIRIVALETRKRFSENELTAQQQEQLEELLGKWFLFIDNARREVASPPDTVAAHVFGRMDNNSDGKLSKAEVAENKVLNGSFAEYDTNRDGSIDSAELVTQMQKRMVAIGASVEVFTIPDPDSKSSLLSLLENRSVARELGLSSERQEKFREAKKELSRYRSEAGAMAIQLRVSQEDKSQLDTIVESSVQELLSEKEWQRLRQVAFQVEIARKGIALALLDGRLGKQLKIEKTQRDSIAKSTPGESKLLETITEVQQASQKRLLKELTAAQRERAEKLLGKEFQFVEESVKPSIQ